LIGGPAKAARFGHSVILNFDIVSDLEFSVSYFPGLSVPVTVMIQDDGDDDDTARDEAFG
jgi:hypothetical protein